MDFVRGPVNVISAAKWGATQVVRRVKGPIKSPYYTFEDTKIMASDALLTSMDFYFEDNRPVPAPSVAEQGEVLINLPSSTYAKVLLLNALLEQNWLVEWESSHKKLHVSLI